MVLRIGRRQHHARTLQRTAQRGIQHIVLALLRHRRHGQRTRSRTRHRRKANGDVRRTRKEHGRDGKPFQERPHGGGMVPARRTDVARVRAAARVPRPRVQRRHHAHRLPEPVPELRRPGCAKRLPRGRKLRGLCRQVCKGSGTAADFIRLLPRNRRREGKLRAPVLLRKPRSDTPRGTQARHAVLGFRDEHGARALSAALGCTPAIRGIQRAGLRRTVHTVFHILDAHRPALQLP